MKQTLRMVVWMTSSRCRFLPLLSSAPLVESRVVVQCRLRSRSANEETEIYSSWSSVSLWTKVHVTRGKDEEVGAKWKQYSFGSSVASQSLWYRSLTSHLWWWGATFQIAVCLGCRNWTHISSIHCWLLICSSFCTSTILSCWVVSRYLNPKVSNVPALHLGPHVGRQYVTWYTTYKKGRPVGDVCRCV